MKKRKNIADKIGTFHNRFALKRGVRPSNLRRKYPDFDVAALQFTCATLIMKIRKKQKPNSDEFPRLKIPPTRGNALLKAGLILIFLFTVLIPFCRA